MRLPKKLKSVRFVLTFWYSALLLVAFVLFGATMYVYLQHLLESRLDRDLVEEVDWIAQITDLERSRLGIRSSIDALSYDIQARIAEHFSANPRNYIVTLTTVKGAVLYESTSRGQSIVSLFGIYTTNVVMKTLHSDVSGRLRVAGKRVDPFLIMVGYTQDATQAVLGNMISIFSILTPVVLFFAFSGGWLMAGMILRPVRQIASLANRITTENLDERIPPRDVDDDIGMLITTMNRMIGRFQSSFENMKQFSMNVAHELKTPLTIMKGESEMALSKSLSRDDVGDLITSYLEETVRMSRIVDDLLTLAKADSGQLAILKEQVRVDEIIRELREDATILSSHKNLSVEFAQVEHATVLGDETRLRQLFRILITNAVQYTDPGGSIRLGCRRAGPDAAIAVEDTGIGIPAESIPRIFERFYRVDKARTRVKGGSGLGLSLAQWIVASHGGTIVVDSEVGKGSRFTVRLPLFRTP